MINRDDLDVSALRVLDRLEKMDSKLDRLLEAEQVGGTKMFDANDVKRMLNISDSTLWRYCKRGLKNHVGKRGRRMFYYNDLMEFIRGKM